MKDKNLSYPVFKPFHSPYAKLKSLSLHLTHFKMFHTFSSVDKQAFLVQTMAFQANLRGRYVFQSCTMIMNLFQNVN